MGKKDKWEEEKFVFNYPESGDNEDVWTRDLPEEEKEKRLRKITRREKKREKRARKKLELEEAEKEMI